MSEKQGALGGRLAEFLVALARADVDFVLCGGAACVLHGISRITMDLDIAIDYADTNVRRLVEVAKSHNLQPRIPEPIESLGDSERRLNWIETKGADVFTLVSLDSPLQVDIFLRYPIAYEHLARNAESRVIGDTEFRISSREDLIVAKQQARPQRTVDVRDIEDLQELLKRDRRK